MGLLSAGAFIRWGFCPPGLLSVAVGAFIRGAFFGGTFVRGAFVPGAFVRGAFVRGAFVRVAFVRGAFVRGAFVRGAFVLHSDNIYVDYCGRHINYSEELFIVEKKNSTEESIDVFKNIVLHSINQLKHAIEILRKKKPVGKHHTT